MSGATKMIFEYQNGKKSSKMAFSYSFLSSPLVFSVLDDSPEQVVEYKDPDNHHKTEYVHEKTTPHLIGCMCGKQSQVSTKNLNNATNHYAISLFTLPNPYLAFS